MAIERKTASMRSVSIQFTDKQDENIYVIANLENMTSKAEVIRKAFDFYVSKKYPALLERTAS